tara:strand:- start:338 stop:505 length:168 start_codon:yes stop_codon:yes gene_type:complete
MDEQVPADAILQELQARYPQELLISVQAVRIAALLNHIKECGCEHCAEHAGTIQE